MASLKQSPLRRIGEQIQSIMPLQASPTPGPVEVAKVIESYESVPAVFQEFFRTHLSPQDDFPYTVLTPTYKVPGEIVSGKLVCTIGHTFYVLEEEQNNLTKVCYPIDEINTVEVIHRPLDLYVKINGVTNLGLPAVSVFGCGRSTSQIFAPLFQRIRLRIVSLNEKAPSRHVERLDRWNELDTQVIDMARHCLMPGETVIKAILQPEIRPGLFSPDRILHGTRCPTHICILTDKELVMIRDDQSGGKKEPCGSICNFVPLNKIDSLTVTRETEKLLNITILIVNGEVFETLFDVSQEEEVNQFLERTRLQIPKEQGYRRD